MEFASAELPTDFNPATCIRKGLCPVIDGKGLESHSLYFEQHGRGDKYKILLIMGLNVSSFWWKAQVEWFGGGKAFQDEGEGERSTVLVFDNRGVGNSGYPLGPYTTKGMAEDAVKLLDYVGWTGEREVHVVGLSLGGMIAQELALKIPQRIGSLVLTVTTAGGRVWNNLPPWKGVTSLARLMVTSDPVKQAPIVMSILYPEAWLDKEDEEHPGRTNRDVETEAFLHRLAITKRQAVMGHVSQIAAGLIHHIDKAGLRRIGASVGRVTIVTGDEDHLIRPSQSRRMRDAMGVGSLVEWTGTGHAVHTQWRHRFNTLVEQTVSGCI